MRSQRQLPPVAPTSPAAAICAVFVCNARERMCACERSNVELAILVAEFFTLAYPHGSLCSTVAAISSSLSLLQFSLLVAAVMRRRHQHLPSLLLLLLCILLACNYLIQHATAQCEFSTNKVEGAAVFSFFLSVLSISRALF